MLSDRRSHFGYCGEESGTPLLPVDDSLPSIRVDLNLLLMCLSGAGPNDFIGFCLNL
jgi:hypothetical protein